MTSQCIKRVEFFLKARVGFDTYPSFYLMLDLWYKGSPRIATILVAFFKKYLRLEYYNDEIIINTITLLLYGTCSKVLRL